jgi:peptide/nickel transport system ATP-binding protein
MSAVEAPRPASVDVEELRIELVGAGVDVVDEIALQIYPGEVLGLVGESGSGKTTVGMALLGHTRRGGRVSGGEVRIDERELGALSQGELRRLRGGTVSYIPQDPGTSLNPALRIGTQLAEILDAHAGDWKEEDRKARVREALEEVALPSDDAFLRRYPHQLSGGQQQRVAIAMAFANRPHVIVCDEPTTGLDVTTQARVLQTVRELCRSHRVAALYVSHDLAVVAELADRVAVMYAGRIIESGPRERIFAAPRHPYTRLLLSSLPEVGVRFAEKRLRGVPGRPPSLLDPPTGCRFRDRCPLAFERCVEEPPFVELDEGHHVACWKAG